MQAWFSLKKLACAVLVSKNLNSKPTSYHFDSADALHFKVYSNFNLHNLRFRFPSTTYFQEFCTGIGRQSTHCKTAELWQTSDFTSWCCRNAKWRTITSPYKFPVHSTVGRKVACSPGTCIRGISIAWANNTELTRRNKRWHMHRTSWAALVDQVLSQTT